MSSTETLCLRWNEFESNIKQGFSQLRDDEDFFDVTLACGSRQIKAHKVILSTCSSFFRSLIKSVPHEHPLLYLRGVDFNHLESVLSFMYNGEVRVEQKELNDFLSVAQELRVNGLVQDKNLEQTSDAGESPSGSPSQKDLKHSQTLKNHEMEKKRKKSPVPCSSDNENSEMDDVIFEGSTSILNTPFMDLPTLESQEDLMDPFDDEHEQDESEYLEKDIPEHESVIDTESSPRTNELLDAELLKYVSERDSNNLFSCLKCPHKSRFKRDVKRHVEARHLATCFRCDKCTRIFKTRRSLSKHKMRIHRGEPFYFTV
ncbi:uncharacterized protein [Lepeophtheirus salmonis]|uniref:Broad-complex core protein n=1 Tax=Lepeophtheirus salmonis TaxID=72036 RepID=A0A0K2T8Q1_LEPSM|nr:zinc finger protein 131-like [Lepeophtheirus salmonis]XP_040580710.1 zinc finger protein 131-like [Lepeophtheirus salmonis]XP_040580711.1 zinc finger protein 131-like [Lepeophtheirus salmonis]